MANFTHVVFDIDGTLVDNESAVLRTWQEALNKLLGKKYDIEDLRFVLGIPGVTSMERLGIEDSEKAFSLWSEIFKSHRNDIRLFDGIEDLITTLHHNGIRLGIATSRLRSELDNDDALCKVLDYFSTLICMSDTPRPKPFADPLLAYMRKEKCESNDVVYIGDSAYDCQCAQSAGVNFIEAAWGHGGVSKIQDTIVASTPADILELIKR